MKILKPSLVLSPLLALSLNACLFSEEPEDITPEDSQTEVKADSIAVIDSITGDTTYVKETVSDSTSDTLGTIGKDDSTLTTKGLNFKDLFKQGFYDISIDNYDSDFESPQVYAGFNQSESETPRINSQNFEFNWGTRTWDEDSNNFFDDDDDVSLHIYSLSSQGWNKSEYRNSLLANYDSQGNLVVKFGSPVTISINETIDLNGKTIEEISDDLTIFEDFQFSENAATYDLGYLYRQEITIDSDYECERVQQLDEVHPYSFCINGFSPISEREEDDSYKGLTSWEDVIAFTQSNSLRLDKVGSRVKLFENGNAQFEGYNDDGDISVNGTWSIKNIHGHTLYIMNQPASSKYESQEFYTSFITEIDGYFYTGTMIEEETNIIRESILFNNEAFKQLGDYLKDFDLSTLNPEQLQKLKRLMKSNTKKTHSWF